jgi:hypothetical protein
VTKAPATQTVGWRRDAAVSLATAVIVALVTYLLTMQAERQRQLVVGRQAEQLRDASVAVVSVAQHVGASLGAADQLIRSVELGSSPAGWEAGRQRWNAADSAWATDKIGLAHVLDRAVQDDSVDAAWSHMDSTVFLLGEHLTAAFAKRGRLDARARREAARLLGARRDTAQAALERFLQLMRPALAVR